jgi:integrase
MSDLLKDVIADYELEDRHSIETMARPLIEKRLMPYFGRFRASNVKVPTITAYIRHRKEHGAAVASVNRELALLRRSFKLGAVNGKIGAAHVPDFTQLLQKEKNARQGFWEHTEYEEFRDALPVDERAIFIFGYWTGCRFGEIAQLEWNQVDLKDGLCACVMTRPSPENRASFLWAGPAVTCMTCWRTRRSVTRPYARIPHGYFSGKAARTQSASPQGVVVKWWTSERHGRRP